MAWAYSSHFLSKKVKRDHCAFTVCVCVALEGIGKECSIKVKIRPEKLILVPARSLNLFLLIE